MKIFIVQNSSKSWEELWDDKKNTAFALNFD